MSMLVAAFVGLCLYVVVRLLNLASPSAPPTVYAKTTNSEFFLAIISSCPILRETYVPPLIWGKSGHIQTVVYAKVGRMREPIPSGVRHTRTLHDGATLTFDVFEPKEYHVTEREYCMLVCPGFGSSSESSYIRALVTSAQSSGYRVAVLNHLGSLFNVKLTAPRIFTYGGWEEFHTMRKEMERMYPRSKLIIVGLSMGANIVLKYLGEDCSHQSGVLCAFSICQGYNINEAKHLMMQWANMRRAYLYTMTANQIRLINHHRDVLFSEEILRQFSLDQRKINSATILADLDKHFSCKLLGCDDVVDYYERNSCCHYINNINIPLVLINAEDDPIVPPALFKYAKDYAESHDHALFITTKHGGHLGYYENGYLRPLQVSWIDRCVCQLADAIVDFMETEKQSASGPSWESTVRKEEAGAAGESDSEKSLSYESDQSGQVMNDGASAAVGEKQSTSDEPVNNTGKEKTADLPGHVSEASSGQLTFPSDEKNESENIQTWAVHSLQQVCDSIKEQAASMMEVSCEPNSEELIFLPGETEERGNNIQAKEVLVIQGDAGKDKIW